MEIGKEEMTIKQIEIRLDELETGLGEFHRAQIREKRNKKLSEEPSFIEKHFGSVTWIASDIATIITKYSWITLLISTVLAIIIGTVIEVKHEAIIAAIIFCIINFGISLLCIQAKENSSNMAKRNNRRIAVDVKINNIETQIRDMHKKINALEDK